MAIGYEATEWKDGAQGGTPIDAAALNKMENGISEACAAVDLLNQEGNVTTEDIASKAVTTEKIADGAVGLDQLSEEVRDSVSQRIASVADDRFVLLSGQVTERTLTVSDSEGFVIGSVLSISTGNDNVHPLGFAVDGDTITVKIVNIHSEGVWAQPRVTVSLRRS